LNFYSLIFCLIGIFICMIYSIWLYNKLIFLIPKFDMFYDVNDLTFLEISLLLPILFHFFWLGIYPSFFFDFVSFYISFYYFELLDWGKIGI
jgi:NADH:ubiquinone oxidoreductase subunit 4 (subunit M)